MPGPVSAPPGGLPAPGQAVVPPAEPLEPDLVSVPLVEQLGQEPVSVPPVELRDPDLLVPVLQAGPHDQDPVSVLGAGSLDPGLVPVAVRLERVEQWGGHGILCATLQPAHVGVVQKISGHSDDLVGGCANRDRLAENYPSNEDFVYTTHSTSKHTRY